MKSCGTRSLLTCERQWPVGARREVTMRLPQRTTMEDSGYVIGVGNQLANDLIFMKGRVSNVTAYSNKAAQDTAID